MAQWTRGRHELDRPGTTRRYEALTNASGDRTDSVITMLRADTTEFLTEDEFQIAMARLYPAQHFLEVVQVVKRVVQSDVGDRGTVHLASIPMDSARSNQSVPVR